MLSLLWSCSDFEPDEQRRNIRPNAGSELSFVVLHSYNNLGQEGAYFRKYMSDHFRSKHNLVPSIHHIYLDLVYSDDPANDSFGGHEAFADMITGYNPDVLFINDDPALDYMFDNFDSLLKSIPAVFAGVSAPRDWKRSEYPLLTGIEDPVDLAANCEIFSSLTHQNNPTVELDRTDYDNRLRHRIYDNISDHNRYINNGDFHISDIGGSNIDGPEYSGKIVIDFISMADRATNRPQNSPEIEGLANTANIMAYASISYGMQIQVKYDIFSNELIDLVTTPQLTCIREQFGFDTPIFLAGYFTSVETQIEDQIHYALRIIDGEKPENIPVVSHPKAKYMDWNAMQLMDPPYKYRDYSNEYTIVNAPFSIRRHFLYCLIIIVSVLILLLLMIFLSVRRIKSENAETDKLLNDMKIESSKRLIALGGKKSGFFMMNAEDISFILSDSDNIEPGTRSWSIDAFRNRVHPDSYKSFDLLTEGRISESGNGRIRLRYDIDGDGWHWWDIFFCRSTKSDDSIVGISINIDSVVEYENSVQQSMDRAVEVSAKQNFIANITHDIRTPLNAIAGFAQLLADGCSDEERIEYSEIISMNTEQLLNLIDSAVKMPADSTEVMSIKMRNIDLAKLLVDSYRTNRILKPAHLDFHFSPGTPLADGTVPVFADSVRTNQVINNFVSNAFKYTLEGSVTLGWTIVDDIFVEVFVADTGIGISEEDGKIIHERYSMAHDNNRGTGLGLDICRTVIQKQNGEYGFTSKVGEGSRFWFRLPIRQTN